MARGRAHDLRAGGSRRTMETFLQSSRTRAAVSLRRRVVLAGPVQLCGGGSCASRGGCAGQPALLLGARAAASATFVARSSSVRLASVSAEGGGADARLDGHDNLLSAMERDLLSNRFVDAAKKALFALKAGTDVEDERAKQILKGTDAALQCRPCSARSRRPALPRRARSFFRRSRGVWQVRHGGALLRDARGGDEPPGLLVRAFRRGGLRQPRQGRGGV